MDTIPNLLSPNSSPPSVDLRLEVLWTGAKTTLFSTREANWFAILDLLALEIPVPESTPMKIIAAGIVQFGLTFALGSVSGQDLRVNFSKMAEGISRKPEYVQVKHRVYEAGQPRFAALRERLLVERVTLMESLSAPADPKNACAPPSSKLAVVAARTPAKNATNWKPRTEKLFRRMWEARRRIYADIVIEREVMALLRESGVAEEQIGPWEVGDEGYGASRYQKLAETQPIYLGGKSRVLQAEVEANAERQLRRKAEKVVEDIRREQRAPFVVPALLDAFVNVSELTTALLEMKV
ncbi:hypothetical protein MKEN_00510900 [Mycena kentingensis (nom. inval.)]|nr:hypothetical protein MKEN_00510900 [Mycena kentingensis (nom. inval.)]